MPWRGNQSTLDYITTFETPDIFINETGDKMTGVLDMNLNKIINVPTPINPADVANRDYVDIITNNTKLFIKDRYPKVYGFRLEKNVSSTDYETTVTIVVPNGVSPNRIFFHTFHPLIRDVNYRVVAVKGSHTSSKAYYHLTFFIPTANRPYKLITEGLVYILHSDIVTFSGKSITVSLETETPSVSVNEVDDSELDTQSDTKSDTILVV